MYLIELNWIKTLAQTAFNEITDVVLVFTGRFHTVLVFLLLTFEYCVNSISFHYNYFQYDKCVAVIETLKPA